MIRRSTKAALTLMLMNGSPSIMSSPVLDDLMTCLLPNTGGMMHINKNKCLILDCFKLILFTKRPSPCFIFS